MCTWGIHAWFSTVLVPWRLWEIREWLGLNFVLTHSKPQSMGLPAATLATSGEPFVQDSLCLIETLVAMNKTDLNTVGSIGGQPPWNPPICSIGMSAQKSGAWLVMLIACIVSSSDKFRVRILGIRKKILKAPATLLLDSSTRNPSCSGWKRNRHSVPECVRMICSRIFRGLNARWQMKHATLVRGIWNQRVTQSEKYYAAPQLGHCTSFHGYCRWAEWEASPLFRSSSARQTRQHHSRSRRSTRAQASYMYIKFFKSHNLY